jgi:DNA-binding winged helix-turn-helix (wHTH) protein
MKLRLGDMTFDPQARQLLRGRAEVHLSPKAFDLLAILIEERPRAVPKDELHQRLWPSTFVSEANLASLAAEIREALGDTARDPRFIRTAHRFGYAFCGEALELRTGSVVLRFRMKMPDGATVTWSGRKKTRSSS